MYIGRWIFLGAMAAQMVRLGRDFNLRRQMGNIGYERVMSGYTYEQFLAAYHRVYEEAEEVDR